MLYMILSAWLYLTGCFLTYTYFMVEPDLDPKGHRGSALIAMACWPVVTTYAAVWIALDKLRSRLA